MPSPKPAFFDAIWYLARNPDVAAAGMDPLRHYLRFGRAEGRLPCALVAHGRARDLNLGLAGIADLEALRTSDQAPERVWASIAIARAHARAGDWQGAATAFEGVDLQRDLIAGFAQPDPILLLIDVQIKTDQLTRAQASLSSARRAFGQSPDLVLAQANIIGARTGIGPAWRRSLRALFARSGRRAPGLSRTGTTPFDRLEAKIWRKRGRHGPKVSVIMPVRDAGGTIDTALGSLRAQSWQTLEILVVDNGSTDDTAQRVRAHMAQDPRIQLIDGADEPGTYSARNLGLAAATGDFITVLDGDDWAHPERIFLQARALGRNPQAQASLSHWARADTGLHFTRWWGEAGLIHPNMSSLMIRAGLRDTIGFWDRTRAGADSEYHERLTTLMGGPEAVLEVAPGLPLSFGRVHAGTLTQDPATHISTQHSGARRDYLMAARRWHAGLVGAPAPLPQHPLTRPFPVPATLSVGDPEGLPGPSERMAQSDLFDAGWILQTYPDLRARGVDPVSWYLSEGAAQGRDPGPAFSTSGYGMSVDLGTRNPLLHALAQDARPDAATCLPDLPGDLPAPAAGTHQMFVGHLAGPSLFGAERSLLDMLDRAIACGVTPSVLLPHLMNADYHAALTARCHRIHIRPFGWRYGYVSAPAATVNLLVALLRDTGVVALHQNTSVLDAPLSAARRAGIPSTVHVRELPDENASLCFDLGLTAPELRSQLLGGTDHLVANAPAVVRWLDAPHVQLRPNSAAPALFDLPFDPATPPRVALIGSLTPEKGLHHMTALSQMARDKGTDLQFVLIGPDSPALNALGRLPENIIHAGYAPSPIEAMAQADIVLSLSQVAESYGRVLLEAMAAGRPVITYDRGAPPDVVGRTSAAGHVVEADDIIAVLDALEDITATPETLQRFSRGARARARAIEGATGPGQDHAIFALSPSGSV